VPGAGALTTCVIGLPADAKLSASPVYEAASTCEPATSAEVVQVPFRTLPVPARTIALQPEIEIPLSVNLTVPVGAFPVTVAVMVTAAPVSDGFGVAVSVVVVTDRVVALAAVVARAVFE
jgi:hypothetical protein